MNFTIGSTTLDYFQIMPDPFGLQRTARSVEIALGKLAFERFKGQYILEVGNTLHQYIGGYHLCVDQFDPEQRVIQKDILGFEAFGAFDLVISISTIEHIGYDTTYHGNEKKEGWRAVQATRHCYNLMRDGGSLLATWDIGANPFLDLAIEQKVIPFGSYYYLAQDPETLQWSEISQEQLKEREALYGHDRDFSRDLFVGCCNFPL